MLTAITEKDVDSGNGDVNFDNIGNVDNDGYGNTTYN